MMGKLEQPVAIADEIIVDDHPCDRWMPLVGQQRRSQRDAQRRGRGT